MSLKRKVFLKRGTEDVVKERFSGACCHVASALVMLILFTWKLKSLDLKTSEHLWVVLETFHLTEAECSELERLQTS